MPTELEKERLEAGCAPIYTQEDDALGEEHREQKAKETEREA